MKTILVPALSDAGQRSRIGAACSVAKAVDGYLSCLAIIGEPPRHLELPTGLGEASPAEDSIALNAFNRSRLEQEFRHQHIAYQWVSDPGPTRSAIQLHAPLNDLIVLSSIGSGDDDPDVRIVASLLGKLRQPTLAIPQRSGLLDVSGAVVVAWDGSSACEATLRSAVPLLKAACEVHVISVRDERDPLATAAYCRHHGIKAHGVSVPRHGKVIEVLLARASMVEASYLVMGAYGHSRTCAELFGGVTHEMLHFASAPLLISA